MISYEGTPAGATRVLALSQPVTGWDLSGQPVVIQPRTADAGQWAVLAGVTRAVVLAATVVLAGCASLTEAFDALTGKRQTPTASEAPLPEPPVPPRIIPKARPHIVPEPAPVVVAGLSGNAVLALLGQPASRAGTAPGETWTYRSGPCELELFLFPDVTQGGLHVLDYRVSGAGPREDSEQVCLRRMRSDQNS